MRECAPPLGKSLGFQSGVVETFMPCCVEYVQGRRAGAQWRSALFYRKQNQIRITVKVESLHDVMLVEFRGLFT